MPDGREATPLMCRGTAASAITQTCVYESVVFRVIREHSNIRTLVRNSKHNYTWIRSAKRCFKGPRCAYHVLVLDSPLQYPLWLYYITLQRSFIGLVRSIGLIGGGRRVRAFAKYKYSISVRRVDKRRVTRTLP